MTATTSQNDSFPLPAFEDRLWSELEQLHEERFDRGPILPPPGPDRRMFLAMVGGLVAAAAVASVVLVVTDDDSTTTVRDTTTPVEQESTTVPDTTTPAPAPGQDAVAVSESVWANGATLTYWLDESTGTARELMIDASGVRRSERVVVVEADGGAGQAQETLVNHLDRTYATTQAPGAGRDVRSDERLADQIARGQLVAEGSEIVDGRELLRFSTVGGGRVVLADPVTMRPLRELFPASVGSAYTTTHTYLPRTPENLALLELQIPEGYREVDPRGNT